jgi:uncharacterized protein (TIGR02118 family)
VEKVVFFMGRSARLTHEEFCEHYLTTHSALVLRHFAGLRGYIVNLLDGEARTPEDAPEAFATVGAIAEMWFDAIDEFTDRARRYASAEGATAVEQDAAEIFSSGVAYHVAQEVQRDYERAWADGQPSPGVKMVYPVRRKQDVPHDQFVQHWQGKHVPIVLQYMNGISRYVTDVVVAPIGKAPEIDGIVELHYLRPEAMQGARYNAPEADAIMADDVAKFLDPSGIAYRTTEHILRS